jgi:hypothetical protein
VAYDILTAMTSTSVCTICSSAIEPKTNYLRSGYDARHETCHEELQAAVEKAASTYVDSVRAAVKKAGLHTEIPTDKEQRDLYQAAKKAGTLDLVVKSGRQAKDKEATKEEAAPTPKVEAVDTATKEWETRVARINLSLELNRITKEEHAAGIAKLGPRPTSKATASK